MRFIYTRTFAISFSIFVLIAAIVVSDYLGYLGLVKDGYLRVEGSAANGLSQATDSAKEFLATLFTIRKLVSENASLRQKINELSFENARLQQSGDENAALRNSLNFKQQSALALIPAEVISADPTGFSQIVVISKGSDAGVTMGHAVVVSPGLLVGKITAVYPHSSQVTLITDPGSVINGEVTDSGAQGLVTGEHGLGLSFGLISQNEVIKTSDNVVTSGLSQDLPKGLLIGQIDSIQSSNSELFQKAFVSPAADLRNLKFVAVVQ